VTLTVPPLRGRSGDIGPIARRLLADVAPALGRPEARLGDEALAALLAYPWPGNVRELRNEISRAVALSEGDDVGAAAFSSRVLQGQAGRSVQAQSPALPSSGTLVERLDAVEAMLLRETLLRHRWNKTRAAAELGLSRVGLRGKMKRFGLED
jgi:two-component system response regulator HupR/HoxA